MQVFFLLFFLHICVLDGFKTWFKPLSIRLSNYALLESLTDADNKDELHDRQKWRITRLSQGARWEFMYRATNDYCQQHQQLPRYDFLTSFEGQDDVNIGAWVGTQKQRYKGTEGFSSLKDDQRSKLMAIDKFREWTEDSLHDDDVRWEFMYRAFVDYCKQHRQLPRQRLQCSFDGQDDLKLGGWMVRQQQRYKGKDRFSSLTDEQLNKLMAIDAFREWAEDPLTDDDVRWEFVYRATVAYCQQHQQLPLYDFTTSFEGQDDLNLGAWMARQKRRYKGVTDLSSLSDEQRNKLMAIDAFREWAEDSLRDNYVRSWEFMYRATVAYCQHHQQLPRYDHTTSFEGQDDLNLRKWVDRQKHKYKGTEGFSSLTDEQRSKLMAIDAFRELVKVPPLIPLNNNDVRWEFMYRALVFYYQRHRELPPCGYQSSFEGHDDLNLGVWLANQKRRYDGKGRRTSLTGEQRNKLIAIDAFREWAEDPLRGDDVRWEFMYRATVDYCKLQQQLPLEEYITSFEGYDDLNLGVWVTCQKQRYDGKGRRASLTDDQLHKLMAIDKFREWAEDPLTDDDVRWEFIYRATVAYCRQHQQLPRYDFTTSFEGQDDLNLGAWMARQKRRYIGKNKMPLHQDRHDKLMKIPEFKSWAFNRFGTTLYSDCFNAHAHVQVKTSGSREKSTLIKQ